MDPGTSNRQGGGVNLAGLDMDGDGDGLDEASIGLGVIGVAATLGGASVATGVGIGIAGVVASIGDRGH